MEKVTKQIEIAHRALQLANNEMDRLRIIKKSVPLTEADKDMLASLMSLAEAMHVKGTA